LLLLLQKLSVLFSTNTIKAAFFSYVLNRLIHNVKQTCKHAVVTLYRIRTFLVDIKTCC